MSARISTYKCEAQPQELKAYERPMKAAAFEMRHSGASGWSQERANGSSSGWAVCS